MIREEMKPNLIISTEVRIKEGDFAPIVYLDTVLSYIVKIHSTAFQGVYSNGGTACHLWQVRDWLKRIGGEKHRETGLLNGVIAGLLDQGYDAVIITSEVA